MQAAWANPFHAEERRERGVLPGFHGWIWAAAGRRYSRFFMAGFVLPEGSILLGFSWMDLDCRVAAGGGCL